uniref:Uncharacterized protein n=1 Tax=Peronospora matthiolae TaxID=2874970 RepID=A0AAV1U735_9STRA
MAEMTMTMTTMATMRAVISKTRVGASLDPGTGRVAATVEVVSAIRGRGTGPAVVLMTGAFLAHGNGHGAASNCEALSIKA